MVIGVHAPEFAFEKNVDNVEEGDRQISEIDYPVAIDNDYKIWRAFDNEYWPAHYFIDCNGKIRHHHFGEGDYARIREGHPEAAGRSRQQGRARRHRCVERLGRGGGCRSRPTSNRPRHISAMTAASEFRLARRRGAVTRKASTPRANCSSTNGRSSGNWTIGGRARAARRAGWRHRLSLPCPRPASRARARAERRASASASRSTASRRATTMAWIPMPKATVSWTASGFINSCGSRRTRQDQHL